MVVTVEVVLAGLEGESIEVVLAGLGSGSIEVVLAGLGSGSKGGLAIEFRMRVEGNCHY